MGQGLFLDNVHAKIYLGKRFVVVGSANLSRNGLQVGGLREACVLTDDRRIHSEAAKYVGELIAAATRQYPNKKAKERALERLRHIDRAGRKVAQAAERAFFQWRPENDSSPIHIAWYVDTDAKLNEDGKEAAANYHYDNWHQYSEKDKIQPGDWLLPWIVKVDGQPRKHLGLRFERVVGVQSRGVAVSQNEDRNYTKAVFVERPQAGRPFVIGKKEKRAAEEAFVATLKDFDYFSPKEGRDVNNWENWSLEPIRADQRPFLSQWHKRFMGEWNGRRSKV